jgi:uroporphyrinogen-III synthase
MKPLRGRGIVVTRPSHQAARLSALIEAAGGRALAFPTIAIEDIADPAPALRLLERLEDYALAIFISANAVQKGFELLRRRKQAWPKGLRAAAVGGATRIELERQGVTGVIAPRSGADSEALLAEPALAGLAGKRVVIFRGEGGREALAATLTARGAQVDYAECYRRVRPQADAAPLLAAWASGAVDAVTVFSIAALTNLVAMLGPAGARRLEGTPLFVPHARVAEAARRQGARGAIVAGASDEEMMERLVAYFSAS